MTPHLETLVTLSRATPGAARSFGRRRRTSRTDSKRDPHADNELIDDDLPTPSQGGSSGGRIEREIGALDEEKTATGADPRPTSVKKGQRPDGGDEPTLPNRSQTSGGQDKPPPRRTR